METLHQEGYKVFVEIGPKPILLGMGRRCLREGVGVWLPSMRPGQDDWQQILLSLAQLYVRGVAVDWSGMSRNDTRCKVVLPTYPWQRQRYWMETVETANYQTQLLSRNGKEGNFPLDVKKSGQTTTDSQEMETRVTVSEMGLKQIMAQQLQVMSQQLDFLHYKYFD